MKISYKNYRLTAGDGGIMPSNLYDLSEIRTAKKKGTGEEYDKEFTIAYGMTLPRALERVIAAEVNKKQETNTLKEYIKGLKEERREIDKQLKY